jgi:hypothetical protein
MKTKDQFSIIFFLPQQIKTMYDHKGRKISSNESIFFFPYGVQPGAGGGGDE